MKEVCVVTGVNSEGHEWLDGVYEDAKFALEHYRGTGGLSSHTINYDEKGVVSNEVITLRHDGKKLMLRTVEINYDVRRARSAKE